MATPGVTDTAITLARGGTTGIGRVIEPFTARDGATLTLVPSMTDGNATMPRGSLAMPDRSLTMPDRSLAMPPEKSCAMATGRGWESVLATAPGPRA